MTTDQIREALRLSPTAHAIVVFPDGETWNTVDGCIVKVISDPDFKDLCDDRLDASDVPSIAEIALGGAS